MATQQARNFPSAELEGRRDAYESRLIAELGKAAASAFDGEDPKTRASHAMFHLRLATEAALRIAAPGVESKAAFEELRVAALKANHHPVLLKTALHTLQHLCGGADFHVSTPGSPEWAASLKQATPAFHDTVEWLYSEVLQQRMPTAVRDHLARLAGRGQRRAMMTLAFVSGAIAFALFGSTNALGTATPRAAKPVGQVLATQPVAAPQASVAATPTGSRQGETATPAVTPAVEETFATVAPGTELIDPQPGSTLRVEREIAHFVKVGGNGLQIQSTEATVAQYRDCVAAGACSDGALTVGRSSSAAPSLCSGGLDGSLPINCITPSEAESLCAWIGAESVGVAGRVPTTKEWRDSTGWAHAWELHRGDALGKLTCAANLCDSTYVSNVPGDQYCNRSSATAHCRDNHVGPAPVGTTEVATASGLVDVVGNVMEFARDESGYARMGRGFRTAVTDNGAARVESVGLDARLSQAGVRCVVRATDTEDGRLASAD